MREKERWGEEKAVFKGMLLDDVQFHFILFSTQTEDSNRKTAPEAEDRKRECDKLAGNPFLKVLIPALISYSNTKQFSLFFSKPVTRLLVIKHKT